jgi:hypothetical protein
VARDQCLESVWWLRAAAEGQQRGRWWRGGVESGGKVSYGGESSWAEVVWAESGWGENKNKEEQDGVRLFGSVGEG